jgi:hypothetical protein
MEGYRIGLLIAVIAIGALAFVSGAISPPMVAKGVATMGVLGGVLIHGLLRARSLGGGQRIALSLAAILAALAAGLGFATNITEWNPVEFATFTALGDTCQLPAAPSGRLEIRVEAETPPTEPMTVKATFQLQDGETPAHEIHVQFLHAGSEKPSSTTRRPGITTSQLTKVRSVSEIRTGSTLTLVSLTPASGHSLQAVLTTFPFSRNLCLGALLILTFLIALLEARGDASPSLTIAALTAFFTILLTQNGLVGNEAVQLLFGGILIGLIPACVGGTLAVAGLARLLGTSAVQPEA